MSSLSRPGRLEACKSIGLIEIEANVVELDDLDRQIAECDENLCGTKLTPSERAVFTRRRKEAYEAKHPETRHGATGRAGYKDDKLSSFSDDTASKTGVDKRTVERDARRGDKIDADVLASIAGTDLDKGVVLDSLASIAKEDQARACHQERHHCHHRRTAMTLPSLLKRLEALEDIQVPSKPIFLWEPYDPTRSQQTAFEAHLAATKAAHPGRPIMIVAWEAA